MVVFIKALQVVLALSLLILIHELGHFVWAKIFGIRVEKFYLFFDVGGVRLARWKWGETEFGIGWLPLGGYCKIAGMVDESMDLKSLEAAPQAWEFRTRPAWQRLLVMAGGILHNLLFALIAYCCIMGIWGERYISNRTAQIYASPLAEELGFRTGDRILRFDEYEPEDFAMLQADLARRGVQNARVLRGTDTLDLYMDQSLIGDVLQTPVLFDLAIPFVVDSVAASGPNARSGLRHGDRIAAFGGQPVSFLQDARGVLSAFAGRETEALVLRGADSLCVPVQVDTAGRIGVYMVMPEIVTRQYDFFGAIPAGLRLTRETIGGYLRDLKLLARPSSGAYKSVGSFIAIGQVFPATWNGYQFLQIIALLSVMLAVMNLLPIPGLDGGHILFTLYEILTGRKPSDRFLAGAQVVGMVLIFALMFLAFGNDIGRLLHG